MNPGWLAGQSVRFGHILTPRISRLLFRTLDQRLVRGFAACPDGLYKPCRTRVETMPGRFSLTVVVLIAAGTWAAALAVGGSKVGLSFFSPASIVVTVLVVLGLAFDRWAWAWPGIRSIWHRPDIRGTWKGEIQSNFSGATDPIEAYLSIHETYSSVTVRLFTQQSSSKTTVAAVATDADDIDTVVGLYRNEPLLSERDKSPIHDGAFSLLLEDKASLRGKYWTDRGTQGEMTFRRVSKENTAGFSVAQVLRPPKAGRSKTRPRKSAASAESVGKRAANNPTATSSRK